MSSTKVNIDHAELRLQAIAEVLKRPLRDVLESTARVVATQCARTAQPFGTGADALQLGRAAVARDIMRCYGLAEKAYAGIAHRGAKAAFWRAYKAGEFDVAERFLNDFGSDLRGVPFEKFDDGAAHKTARNSKTGRVPKSEKPKMIVTNPKELFRYIENVQKNVGFGKGGFADIARALGRNPRGLKTEGDISASWITRHTGFGKFHNSGTADNPQIYLHNAVPYADNILNGGAKADAIRIGRERMLENLLTAVKAEVKTLTRAA